MLTVIENAVGRNCFETKPARPRTIWRRYGTARASGVPAETAAAAAAAASAAATTRCCYKSALHCTSLGHSVATPPTHPAHWHALRTRHARRKSYKLLPVSAGSVVYRPSALLIRSLTYVGRTTPAGQRRSRFV